MAGPPNWRERNLSLDTGNTQLEPICLAWQALADTKPELLGFVVDRFIGINEVQFVVHRLQLD